MNVVLMVYFFLFGMIIGSFLNVVVCRFNTGASLGGRSMCFSCGKTLRWYELVPVLSFVFQAGRCTSCGAKISLQYPFVELVAGLLYMGAFIVAAGDWIYFIYIAIQITLLIIIGVYDLKHKIIPDVFSYVFAGIGLLYIITTFLLGTFSGNVITALLSGPIYFLPFAAVWFLSKGRWMGFGDAKLALGIGWFLGLGSAYVSMMIAFWTGALVGLALIFFGKVAGLTKSRVKITMKSEIPFGPFLIIGVLVVLFFESFADHVLSLFMFY